MRSAVEFRFFSAAAPAELGEHDRFTGLAHLAHDALQVSRRDEGSGSEGCGG
jgi:hypothetical protein